MIFVNYGGGGYRIFRHSPWDGLTIADLVFPWWVCLPRTFLFRALKEVINGDFFQRFIWIMGIGVALSLRSNLRTSASRKKILARIMTRSLVLVILGLALNSGSNHGKSDSPDSFSYLRIPGVLQRIGLTYFVVALTELVFARPQRNDLVITFKRKGCSSGLLT